MSEFLSENFQFVVLKFSIHLNRRVFVMFFRRTYIVAAWRSTCIRYPQHVFSWRNKKKIYVDIYVLSETMNVFMYINTVLVDKSIMVQLIS